MTLVAHDPASIGRLVREERRVQGLTQDDLAVLANLSRKFVIDLERGKPTVQLAGLLRVLDALSLTLELRPRAARHA